jgi:hypothetical protein
VSAQTQESLSTSNQGRIEHASHVGFTLLQGGLSGEKPHLSDMPTPRIDSQINDVDRITPPSQWDCAQETAAHGSRHFTPDFKPAQGYVEVDF